VLHYEGAIPILRLIWGERNEIWGFRPHINLNMGFANMGCSSTNMGPVVNMGL
jgi:hypothetical protein